MLLIFCNVLFFSDVTLLVAVLNKARAPLFVGVSRDFEGPPDQTYVSVPTMKDVVGMFIHLMALERGAPDVISIHNIIFPRTHGKNTHGW